ncbi:transcriptional regulator [ANME-2 cluster archaeon]|nr:MAG: transcriptional regulator [ANME-2 cluster archaeon]
MKNTSPEYPEPPADFAERDRITITARQNEILQTLADGAKTTKDLTRSFMITGSAITQAIKKLRDVGLIRTRREGTQFYHELTAPYPNLIATLNIKAPRPPITEQEIQYVAKLRNAGLTGLALVERFHLKYPNRSADTVRVNIVSKARSRRLCR